MIPPVNRGILFFVEGAWVFLFVRELPLLMERPSPSTR